MTSIDTTNIIIRTRNITAGEINDDINMSAEQAEMRTLEMGKAIPATIMRNSNFLHSNIVQKQQQIPEHTMGNLEINSENTSMPEV